MAWWKPVNVLLSPLVEMFYPLPKSALIPVTVIWLGYGDSSKILLIFLGCMLPVTIGAFNGARSSEQVLVWSARSMGANRLRMLWDVVVPSAMPRKLADPDSAKPARVMNAFMKMRKLDLAAIERAFAGAA